MNPPAHRLNEMFQNGTAKGKYFKTKDAGRILKDEDLAAAAMPVPVEGVSQCYFTTLQVQGDSIES